MSHGPFAGFKGLGVDVLRVDSVAKNELGVRVYGSHGEEFMYVEADGTIAVSDAVTVAGGYLATEAAVGEAVVGVALVALVDGEFGWIQTRGEVEANMTAAVAAGALVASTASAAGVLNDVAAAGDDSIGVTFTGESGGTALVYLR